jgi:undecaprenyl phosphate N,N'-diacetylbacillosamine 1-phosphate transferase
MFKKIYSSFFKRFIDILASICLLIFFLPVLILASIFLWVSLKGNPFFIQKRPGKHGKIFNIIKLKTMTNSRDAFGNLLPDEIRLKWYGKIIRKSSLDEIPQLWNVLIGDMSLIGPRPLLEEYLSLYNDDQIKRHLVRPGITGLAQVNGRNLISWEEKFEYDIHYVNNLSFFLDLKILSKTFFKIIKSEGVNQNENVSMEKFRGNFLSDYKPGQ